MGAWALIRSLNSSQSNTFLASFLGWTLDAFDFFVVTFVVIYIAKDFKTVIPLVALDVSELRTQEPTCICSPLLPLHACVC